MRSNLVASPTSSSRNRRLAALARRLRGCLALGVVLIAPSACETRLCHPDSPIQSDGLYRATVIELYNSQSTFTYHSILTRASGLAMGTCPDTLRPGAGDTIDIQGTGTVPEPAKTCLVVGGEVKAAPSSVSLVMPAADAKEVRGAESLLYAAEDVVIGGCSGALELALSASGSGADALATPTAGSPPPVVLYWLFLPTSGGCQPCDANYVVQLQKVVK